ncbi:gas vesicle protein GvpO [Nocardia sp. NPDC050406]|uniref:gas vesicle protein GvpO n=1 Tax=Nocardia sp. NPDC050406 TaxID=3364318 RepID=UPI0037AA013D
MTERARKPSGDNGRAGAMETAASGVRHIAALTGREVLSATAVRPSDAGWTVEVEVLEDAHIPSSADILSIYELELDEDGNLLSYRRIRRGRRATIGDS